MNKLKKILRRIFHFLHSRVDIFKLKRTKGEEKIIYQIIQQLKNNSVEEVEKESWKKINDLRLFYSKNTNQIAVKDFGFGTPNDTRTQEQMYHGVETTEIISEIYNEASSLNGKGKFIFRLIRNFKPLKCLELGTSLGISAAYIMEALRLNGGNTKFTTIEGAPEIAKLSESTLQDFSFTNFELLQGRFIDVLPQYISENNQIDFAFIDGHHEEKATIKYFQMIYPNLSEKSILLFDDINWSDGMRSAWGMIKKDERVAWTVEDYFVGVAFIDKTKTYQEKTNYKIWISP